MKILILIFGLIGLLKSTKLYKIGYIIGRNHGGGGTNNTVCTMENYVGPGFNIKVNRFVNILISIYVVFRKKCLYYSYMIYTFRKLTFEF